ncbi:hypothetical protein LCGC14_2820160 [marine sediment metagenome]|uniref:Nucleoside 2-deoxyribosyltransferase n=1 Tax=marine sediment metagenome TaxID=412755 RepID=A0A0F9B8F5_9ZZZZ
MVYLSGPIDEISDKERTRGWRERAAHRLGFFGQTAFDPTRAFFNPNMSNAAAVAEVNRCAIRFSVAMLVWLMEPETAFGTIREIEFARARQIPVVIINERNLKSLFSHDVIQVRGMSEAMIVLQKEMGWESSAEQKELPGSAK